MFTFTYLRFIQSPVYSLSLASKAATNGDCESFQKYVDVDSLASQLIDEVTDIALQESQQEVGEFGEALLEGIVELAKPELLNKLKKDMRNYIESREFKKADRIPLFILAIKTLRIAKVQVSGKVARVAIERSNVRVIYKLRKKSGYWQLVSIDNLRELIEKDQQLKLDDLLLFPKN
ncbi:MAG: DUF2939 domain-containing protein [Archaeoglobaceae archaeon]